MKYLLILILFISMSSCDHDDIKVEHPNKVTTLEIKNLAEKDTIPYKVVYLDNTLYLYNIETQVVDMKLNNHSGTLNTFIILFVIACVTCFALITIIDNN